MNSFQFTGYIRNKPEYIKNEKGEVYLAVILSRDGGTISVPVYYKGILARKMQNAYIKGEIRIGTQVNVEGIIISDEVYDDYFIGIRVYLCVKRSDVIDSQVATFKKDKIFAKLLEVEDTDDLFRRKVKKIK